MTRKLNKTEQAFATFCEKTGLRLAQNGSDVGGLVLNHGPNGYSIAQITNEGGGQHKVFGWGAHPRGKFIDMLEFAGQAAELAKK